MTGISPYKRKKLCEHEPACDKFLVISTINEGMTMCERDAKEYSSSINDSLRVVPQVRVRSGSMWTEEQTSFLIEFMRHNDITYGTYNTLAKQLGKTRAQVKRRVYVLRSKGAF